MPASIRCAAAPVSRISCAEWVLHRRGFTAAVSEPENRALHTHCGCAAEGFNRLRRHSRAYEISCPSAHRYEIRRDGVHVWTSLRQQSPRSARSTAVAENGPAAAAGIVEPLSMDENRTYQRKP